MAQKLTDAICRRLPAPDRGNRIHYDSLVRGLGLRVTAAGMRAFVLNYRVRGSGRERRFTIGAFPDWTVGAAREEARLLRQAIDGGRDPLDDLEAAREAPTVGDLCDRVLEEFVPKKRPSTRAEYESVIR